MAVILRLLLPATLAHGMKTSAGRFRQLRGNAGDDETVAMLNEQALAIREEAEALALSCMGKGSSRQDALSAINTKVSEVSAGMTSSVAEQSAQGLVAEQTEEDRRNSRDSLQALAEQCRERVATAERERKILQEDLGKAKTISGVADGCKGSTLLQWCSSAEGKMRLSVLANAQFRSSAASLAFKKAMRANSSAHVAGREWPDDREPLSRFRQRQGSCENDFGPVDCDVLSAEVGQLIGGLEAQLTRATEIAGRQNELCQHHQQLGQAILQNDQRMQSRAEEAMSSEIGGLADLAATRDSVVDEDTVNQFRSVVAECTNRLASLKAEVDRILLIRNSITATPPQDCEVGEWSFSVCAATCFTAGSTNGYNEGKRSQLTPPGKNGLPCPPLTVKLPCGGVPCPVDCELRAWEDWGACSRTCGGGIRSRQRTVRKRPAHGGLACSLAAEREECGIGSCDSDCELGEWTQWSPCSVKCRMSEQVAAGHQVKQRLLVTAATGLGNCPGDHDPQRLLMRKCNSQLCPSGTKCGGEQDIVILLEGGTASSNFGAQVALVKHLVEHSTPSIRFGVAAYGANATVISPVTADHAAVKSALENAKAPPGSPDLAKGEAVVLNVLRASGELGTRQQTVLALADSDPLQPVEATTVAGHLQKTGARLVFGVVDTRSRMERMTICDMATKPCSMNVVTGDSWEHMAKEGGRVMASICNQLEANGQVVS